MPLFTWTPEYSVNVKLFDEQHQKLISLINKLYDAMKEGKGSNVLNDIFNELIEYTQIHFTAEEQMFQKYNYPEKDNHTDEHQALTKQVIKLQDNFKDGRILITVDVLNFLKDWLTKHIMQTDKKYGKYFQEKGISF